MAEIVTNDQQLIIGVTHPISVYSRVVSCRKLIVAGAVQDFTYTPRVGQDVRLFGVEVWFFSDERAAGDRLQFRVKTGVGVPSDIAAIAAWEDVFPVFDGNIEYGWGNYRRDHNWSWRQSRLFAGEGRRFGLWVESQAASVGLIYASFQISEG